MTRQLLTLGVVIAAGLLGNEIIRRIRRTGGLAEVSDRYQAVYDPSGNYLRCEEFKVVNGFRTTVGIVNDSNCAGCGGFDVGNCPK